ncbi:hypothetical protein BJV74DRAFT_854981 [Russula compacta]|nr:hypothetical protein BJV74DRAFT_854981 [Russula compacta]
MRKSGVLRLAMTALSIAGTQGTGELNHIPRAAPNSTPELQFPIVPMFYRAQNIARTEVTDLDPATTDSRRESGYSH